MMDPRAARKIPRARTDARLGRDSEGKTKEISAHGPACPISPHVRHRVRARVTATRPAGERRGYGVPMRPTHSGNIEYCTALAGPRPPRARNLRWPNPHRSRGLCQPRLHPSVGPR